MSGTYVRTCGACSPDRREWVVLVPEGMRYEPSTGFLVPNEGAAAPKVDDKSCFVCGKPRSTMHPDILGRRLAALADLVGSVGAASDAGDGMRLDFEAAATILVSTLRNGGKILVCGNGGSASQAQHFAAELTGRYRAVPERRGLPAIALCADSAALTCIANDFGYAEVFARQVDALCVDGDASNTLLCLSTSGKSQNVQLAAQRAAKRGASVVWITGGSAPVPLGACDAWIRIPSADTALIQELTLSVLHSLCERIEGEVDR